MTLQEIINYVDRKYPNVESNANKVIDLNRIQSDIFLKIHRLSNIYSVNTDVTINEQSEYDLPDRCRIENILKVEVERAEDTNLFDEFIYAGLQDILKYKKVYMRGSAIDKYVLLDNEKPLLANDRIIKIHFFPLYRELDVSDLNFVPDLAEEYHPLLMYGLIVDLANQGNNPDTDIANYYQSRYDEFLTDVIYNLSSNEVGNGRLRLKQQIERW